MNQKCKEIAYGIFYDQFAMVDVFNYIVNVMISCKDPQQNVIPENYDQESALQVAYRWGQNTLGNYYRSMCRHINKKYGVLSLKGVDIDRYCYRRISGMEAELEQIYERMIASED